ncbi:LysR family transcriptional regulator [Brevibacterium sp.]|uniref:LysR family transcriptional regulator n=1 Tax=Brevibacterium sp. TaxID=1701 RepID=UPI0028128840|nr:LysR family transcriptional regulator [Brevibacterium sp.]
MRLSLEQVEAFVLTAQHGSFSAAARALGRTQSTISSAISYLEIALDVEVFDRSSRMPTLTEAGQALLPEARALYDRAVTFERHGDALSENDSPSVTLAIGIPPHQIMPALEDFAETFPHTDLIIRNPDRGDASRLVLADEAELGIAFLLPEYPDELGFHQMGKLLMTHVAHRDHPLATMENPGFDELRGHRHLAYITHSSSLPTSEYLQSTQTWHTDSYEALTALARSGLGWATLPRQLILPEIASGELVELQLDAYPYTDWLVSVDLIWRRGRRFGRVEQWLLDRLRQHRVHEVGRDGQDTTRLL